MDVMLAVIDGREIYHLGQVMFQEGATNDFILKPFDLDQLLERIAVLAFWINFDGHEFNNATFINADKQGQVYIY